MRKRSLAAFVCIIMILALLPTTALADEYHTVIIDGVSLKAGEYLPQGVSTPTTVKPADNYAGFSVTAVLPRSPCAITH